MAERVDPFTELANRRLYEPRGYDRIEYLPPLRGRKAAEVYREMATGDALIGAILFAIEMILRQVEWTVEPGHEAGEEPTEEDIDRADFLESCRGDMSHSWEELIADALTMLAFGFSYMEIVYKRREDPNPRAPAEKRSKYTDGKIGWRKFCLVPQETIEDFDLDDYGGVDAAWQGYRYNLDRVRIPIEKALLFRTKPRGPRGISALRNVVESWYFRKRIRQIEGIGIERDLAGLPVIYADVDILSNATAKAEYQDIIRNLRRDEQEGVLLPAQKNENGDLIENARLELLASGGQRQFNTTEIIQRYGREIAVSLLQDVVLLGHEKVGTQALASEKRDLSDTALQAWLNDIAGVFNTHAVPRLFALNGEPLENLPELKPGTLRPSDVEEFATSLKNIASAGWVFTDEETEAEIRRRLDLPPPPQDDEMDSEPEPIFPLDPTEVPGETSQNGSQAPQNAPQNGQPQPTNR